MKLINIKLPERDIETIDAIVAASQKENPLTTVKYDNRSDFIRVAINALIEQEQKHVQTSRSSGGIVLTPPIKVSHAMKPLDDVLSKEVKA